MLGFAFCLYLVSCGILLRRMVGMATWYYALEVWDNYDKKPDGCDYVTGAITGAFLALIWPITLSLPVIWRRVSQITSSARARPRKYLIRPSQTEMKGRQGLREAKIKDLEKEIYR